LSTTVAAAAGFATALVAGAEAVCATPGLTMANTKIARIPQRIDLLLDFIAEVRILSERWPRFNEDRLDCLRREPRDLLPC
jgi:hypothetical protein